jgi:hypothetical protein
MVFSILIFKKLVTAQWHYLETPYTEIHVEVMVKVIFTLDQATKAQRGSRGIALLFL